MNPSVDAGTSSKLGWTGFFIGSSALLAVIFLFWAGPFAPQQSAGVSLGELAAEIGQSAVRKVTGMKQPDPAPIERNIDDYFSIGAGLLGGLAIIVGAMALVKQERRAPAIAAIGLGGSAVLFQFFLWYALALLGVLLIAALLQSFEGFFESLFGG